MTDTLTTVRAIMRIAEQKSIGFTNKLQQIIMQITQAMHAERGSIMILRGRHTLEVVASTVPTLVGVRQSLRDETPSAWVIQNKRILHVGPGVESILFQKKYGSYKKDAFLVAPIISNKRVLGVLSVTEKKGKDAFGLAERELLLTMAGMVISTLEIERLNALLKKGRQVLARKNGELEVLERVRTELFTMLIHDLKGPISEIVANLEILAYTLTGDNQEYVQAAQHGCETLFRMVSNLLDITRMEEGVLKLLPERIAVGELIHEAIVRMSGMARARGIELREVVPEEAGQETFTGDRGMLSRVLQNLLINAIQHSPAGALVEAGAEPSRHAVHLYVQDHGPGIAPEFQQAIFDKFFQITKKHDGRRYSTGLGLTFCKMAVEAHRGTIAVQSDGVKGTRFICSIPAP